MLKIPYGESNFGRIRTQNYLYVDKTHFIEQLEPIDRLIHLRPRRFGKSLFISMLEAYYDVAQADKFDPLFKGLYIHENPTEYQNSYYILRFNFSGIENVKPDDLQNGFNRKVSLGIQKFISKYNLSIDCPKDQPASGILDSCMAQFKELNLPHKIYVLIDEYDHFTNALLTGDGHEFLSVLQKGGFVRSFYEVLKENSEEGVVERLFMTGVMSVTLDSMTSGFNVATNITTTTEFSDMMGFTTDEVKELLSLTYAKPGKRTKVVDLTEEEQATIYEVFKDNYNGYLFSKNSHSKVFNSTLIMHYMKNYLRSNKPPDSLVDDNLNQTGSTIESIVSLKNREQNYQAIEQIIEEGQIEGTLQPFINIDEKFDKNDLITLLFNIGMLTIKGADILTQFEMPNKIIKNIYFGYLKTLLERQSDYVLDLQKQQDAIVALGRHGDISLLNAVVSEFLSHTSNRNKINFDEKYIKLVYLMILAYTNQLDVYDEFPALQGYSDVFIQKAPNSTAKFEVLIELKYIKKSETTEAKVETKFDEGAGQIKKYMQDERLSKRESLRKYVVVYSGFDVVRMEEL